MPIQCHYRKINQCNPVHGHLVVFSIFINKHGSSLKDALFLEQVLSGTWKPGFSATKKSEDELVYFEDVDINQALIISSN